MEMGKESGRVTKERELQEYIVHTVLFTAGAAVLMACLQRVILTVFLMEQWRAWVFLVLNLILLAILFTPISSTSNFDQNQQCSSNNSNAEVVENIEPKNKRREYYRCPSSEQAVEDVKECDEEICKKRSTSVENEEEGFEDQTEEVSKEALNERVEAFIVMFRQHLVSDARNESRWKQVL
ncbi:PREDICTED: ABC transporter F [Prunus dulcis]|uniref:PREDICTED: ABC transporter F n=1 Tax=Prunus dulcis TaxID=3755 RepID=A0A5E4F309_PRUDU|nr:uncharacterized protein LOC117622852 [Prunus dulcis]KAI5341068.1 hypothetical protein L3X38_020342 [Prunus dulcis]VVA20198.1 PREDICTED: ABC transporter F [Prunus dulcis]